MMINLKIRLLLVSLYSFGSIHGQLVNWVNSVTHEEHFCVVESITIDKNGNIYSLGSFGVVMDLNPGIGIDTFTSNGLYDIFIQKLDANGNFLWAKSFGSADNDFATKIVSDHDNNIYIYGNYSSITDFNPDSSINFSLTPNGNTDVYLLKLDANGNFLWAKGFGSISNDYASDLIVDEDNNLLLAGMAFDTIDFNSSGMGGMVYSSVNNYQGFLLSLNSSGGFNWVQSINGSNPDALELDENGNIYLAVDSVKNLYTVGKLFNRYTSSGHLNWSRYIPDFTGGIAAIKHDHLGNVFFAGSFNNNDIDIDPGPNVHYLPNKGGSDIVIAKFDTLGTFIWGKAIGDKNIDRATSMDIDKDGNILLTGYFEDTVDFDPGAGIHTIISNVGSTTPPWYRSDIFVQKLNNDGSYGWTFRLGSPFGDVGKEIIIDQNNHITLAGIYRDVMDFDPGSSIMLDTVSTLFYDVPGFFIMKFKPDALFSLVNSVLTPDHEIKIFPNPATNSVWVESPHLILDISIYTMRGEQIFFYPNNEISKSINLEELPLSDGIYVMSIHTDNGLVSEKLIVNKR